MLILSVFITCMVITAMLTDLTSFIIPNLLVVIILLTYPILLFIAPVMPDWKTSLMIGGGVFLVGFALFATGAMGGGDVKLLAVIALIVGKPAFPEFVMDVAILGGVLSVVLIATRKAIAYYFLRTGKSTEHLARILKVGEPAPYGVAIGMSFLWLLWHGQVSGVTL